MKRPLRWHDYFTINIYWFSLTTRAQTLTPLIIPLLVQRFVGEAVKGSYMGRVRLWALMMAVLAQALMGLLSDRCTSRWGRRRPFILLGTLGELGVFVLIGLVATTMEGMAGFWVLAALYIGSMLSSNTAHAATQGLIPDLVPLESRGRFSGVKSLLELPLPLVFVSLVIGKLVTGGALWGALIVLATVSVVCTLITMLAPEQRLQQEPAPLNWQPLLRLLLMTATFTAIILGLGALAKLTLRLPTTLSDGFRDVVRGLVAFLTMGAAIVAGVWASVRISIGEEIRRNRSFVWWVVNRLAFLVGATNLSAFMLYFLQERFPELAGPKAAAPATSMMMVVGLLILLAAIPSGYLADRLGRKTLTGAAGILAAIGLLLVVLLPHMWGLYVGGGMIGVATGLFYTANWALGTELVPQEQAGRFLGLSNLAGAGAGAIGAYIGGPLADHTGYLLLFVVYGAMFVLSSLALLGIKEGRVVGA